MKFALFAGFGSRNPGDSAGGREWLLPVLGGSKPRDGPAGGSHNQGLPDRQICENTKGSFLSDIFVCWPMFKQDKEIGGSIKVCLGKATISVIRNLGHANKS